MSEYRIGDRVRVLAALHFHPPGSDGVIVGLQDDWFDVEVEGQPTGQWLTAREMEAL